MGPGVGVGLEGQDHPLVAHGPHRIDRGVELTGMVSIIVIHIRAVELSLELHPAVRAGEGGKALGHRLSGDPQTPGRGGRRQSVEHIVLTGHLQIQMAVVRTVADHIEMMIVLRDIHRPDLVIFCQTEADVLHALQGLHGVLVITVGDDAVGGQLRELMEGILDVLQILEIVQVICLDVQDHRQRGAEIQEGVAVFTALHDDGITVAHPVTGVEQGQITADHDGGVPLGGHEDVGHHRGGSGLAMGAGDADGVLIRLHDHAPCLCPLKDRDTGGTGGLDLRIVVVGGGGTDDALRPLDILGTVTDLHMDAMGDQLIGRNRGIHIRTGNGQPHALKHQPQRPHGNAADTDQMHPASGLDVRLHSQISLIHICAHPPM